MFQSDNSLGLFVTDNCFVCYLPNKDYSHFYVFFYTCLCLSTFMLVELHRVNNTFHQDADSTESVNSPHCLHLIC